MVSHNDVPIKAVFGKLTYAYLFLGLLPFEIKEEGGRCIYVASRKAMISSMGNLLAVISLNGLTLLQSTASPFAILSSGSDWLDTAPYFLDMCMGPALILSIFIKRKSLFRFCENLLSFDRGGLRMESANTHELKIMVLTWMCSSIFMFLIMNITTRENSKVRWVWVTCSWGKVIYFLMQFQYIAAVVALRMRFQRINKYLEQASRSDLTKGKVLEICRVLHHSSRPKISANGWWDLFLLYEKLEEAASHLNTVFYSVMLMNVLLFFMATTYMAFVIVRCIMISGEKYEILVGALIIMCAVAVFTFGMQLYCCHITYTEVERTPMLLHKAFNNSAPDNENKDMVTSAISSYIVIFVQFQLL